MGYNPRVLPIRNQIQHFMRTTKRLFCLSLLVLATLLSGCAKDKEILTAELDARQLYERATNAISAGQFQTAIQHFRALEARYPFSPYALQAQLDIAYAYFRFGRTEESISEAERFIRFNPTHPNVDYAYYIKGLAHFSHRKGFLHSWFPRDPAEVDQKALREAFNTFTALITKFPNSPYAPDAHQRLVFIKNKMAEHEISVANYYLSRNAWIAAGNRANYVLEYYNNTPSTENALAILLTVYKQLDLPHAYQATLKTLRLNYPNNPALQEQNS